MTYSDPIIKLGHLALAFGRVDRITYHDDGVTLESDTDHTVMLGLVACAFASNHLPHLDLGQVAQFALVHDLIEVYAGDTPTLQISNEERVAKRRREHVAYQRIFRQFGSTLPWIPDTIYKYECLDTPAARYVKALDKLLPKITHVLNHCVTIHKQGMSREQLIARYDDQLNELLTYAADFPPLFELRSELIALVLASMGPATSAATNQPEPSDPSAGSPA